MGTLFLCHRLQNWAQVDRHPPISRGKEGQAHFRRGLGLGLAVALGASQVLGGTTAGCPTCLHQEELGGRRNVAWILWWAGPAVAGLLCVLGKLCRAAGVR